MKDYSKGKIFYILYPNGKVLIGYTTMALKKYLIKFKYNHCSIHLILNYPCTSRNEINNKTNEIKLIVRNHFNKSLLN